ncbi:hypothetical protein 9AX5_1, partial [uncultured Caudovirales phage]
MRYVYPPPKRIKRNDLSRRRIRNPALRAFKSTFRLHDGPLRLGVVDTPGTGARRLTPPDRTPGTGTPHGQWSHTNHTPHTHT